MKRDVLLSGIICVLFLSVFVATPTMAEDTRIGMVTGSKTGTYFRFGQEIAEKARSVGLDIWVKDSEGSIDNIKRLNSKENAAFAIVQSDVLGFLKRNPKMKDIADRLRLIFPFYKEEVHLFANTAIQHFEDLQGKRVVLGTEGSGNWLTAVNLLYIMGVEPGEKLYLSPPDAIKAVLRGDADAMFYVAGKPVQVFLNLNDVKAEFPDMIDRVHFVPLNHPKMLEEYATSEIDSEDYAWFDKKIQTIAVKAALVSFNFSSKKNDYYALRCQQLGQLGRVIRESVDDLEKTGHPKWREVDLEERIGIWELDSCSRDLSGTLDGDLEKIIHQSW